MADDPLTLYGADQPLTEDEVQLLEMLRGGHGGERFLDALLDAKVSFADGVDGALFLRCAQNQPGPMEQLLSQLLPRAVDFHRQGRYTAASAFSALSLRLCLAIFGREHRNTLISVDNLAVCLKARGLASMALPLYEHALEVRERVLGADHSDTLRSINNLASCLDSLDLNAKALPLHERALEVRERVLGADHSDTLTSVNNLAFRFKALGLASKALPLFERARDTTERVLGAEHPNTVTSLHNLALCLHSLGLASKALPLCERALDTCERVLGREHPDTLTSFDTLAVCLESLGLAPKALPLYERALEARERVLGAEHPSTLTSVNNLAGCLESLGLMPNALPLYERALEACERVHGAEHPATLTSVNNLAGCLGSLGLAPKALSLYERALEACERVLGVEHPNTLGSVNNLAACLYLLGLASKALPLYERALEARERVLGTEHPDTLISVNSLAGCLQSLSLTSKALPLYERALEAREHVLGAEHPDTLTSINNLAGCLQSLGLASKALPLHERALEACERVLGVGHPNTLGSVNNLALCLQSLSLASKALPLHERALEARERALGPEHPETLTSINSLALCLESLGDVEAAVVRWGELAARLPLRPLAGGTWMQLLENTATAIAGHAKVGRMPDWDLQIAGLSTALQQAIDLQSPEQLEVSRATVRHFFAVHLGLCIDQGRTDLIPQVLAVRQGRKLAALVLDELESQGEVLAAGSLPGRFQAVRVALRRLALGLRTGDDAPRVSMAQPTDRAQVSTDALNERQRAQSEAYNAKLKEYQALRGKLFRTNPDSAIPARALEVSMAQLQARLVPREALLLLFERDDPHAHLALVITHSAALLVPLVGEALVRAGVLSAHWSRALYSRSGMRRGVMPQSELAAAPHEDAGTELPASPLDRLGALLREGLWAPLAAHLGGVQRLHAVTHGSFHLLPLECGGPDKLELCTYPGFIYYYRLRHEKAAASESIAAGGLLGMAMHVAEGEPNLPSIPFVKAEAQVVRALWPGDVHLNPELGQDVPPLAALQLAGHGQVNPTDPARGGLLMGDGTLDLHAVLGAKQRPAVVVLSACTVGRTADDPDGEPLGLVGGFMLKGARIVIASLQPVPDFYMPLLMALFYRGWRERGSPADALADAKRRLALGQWHAETEALVRKSYRGVLVDTLADAVRQTPDSGQLDPLLMLTHAWFFPARFRALHPIRGIEQLAELRTLVATLAGREQMADAVLQTLIDERERLPRQHVDTLCTWVVVFGSAS